MIKRAADWFLPGGRGSCRAWHWLGGSLALPQDDSAGRLQPAARLKRCHEKRPGAILIAVLACLLVALSLVLSAVQSSILARRECKVACLMRQTQLLVEAGSLRAIEKLRQSNDYEGEIWKPKFAIESDLNASVQIRAESSNGQAAADDRKITIIAKLESNERSNQAIQRSFHFIIHNESFSSSELK